MANNCAMINQYPHIKIVSLRKKKLKKWIKGANEPKFQQFKCWCSLNVHSYIFCSCCGINCSSSLSISLNNECFLFIYGNDNKVCHIKEDICKSIFREMYEIQICQAHIHSVYVPGYTNKRFF